MGGEILKRWKDHCGVCISKSTGPLHVGHARQAVLGDAISKILSRVGMKLFENFITMMLVIK